MPPSPSTEPTSPASTADRLSSPVPELMSGTVHIWRLHLDRAPADLTHLQPLLSSPEQQRAARFLRQADRRQYVVSHAALRVLLGHYLNLPPQRVDFAAAENGKPALADSHQSPLRFNLSHSGQLGLAAFALGQEVGIDTERLQPDFDTASVAPRCLTPRELAEWKQLPEAQRSAAFYRCWTHKEAWLKATGMGLSRELDQFEIRFRTGQPTTVLDTLEDQAARWIFHDITTVSGYAAACVTESGISRSIILDWPEDPRSL